MKCIKWAIPVLTIAWLLTSCALWDSPEQGAREWIDGIVNLDGNKTLKHTCLAQRENLKNVSLWASAFSVLGQLLIKQEIKGDISDLKFETISQSGDRAEARVYGELRIAVSGLAEAYQVDEKWQMVKENDTWRWCGSSTGGLPLMPTSTLAPQIAQATLPSMATSASALPPAKKGGLQVLLEADITPGQEGNLDARVMEAARTIIECRANELGVTEPLVQLQGEGRIIVELPNIEDPDQVIATLRETGLLEFVEVGRLRLQEGDLVRTSLDVTTEKASQAITATNTLTSAGTLTDTESLTTTEALTSSQYAYNGMVFKTLMTGRHLRDAAVSTDSLGQVVIAFELTDEGAKIFREYTSKHVGDIVAIILDKRVVSAPVIDEAITAGKGVISSRATGGFPLKEARSIASKMKCGALPVPLREVEVR